jgi:hypothetical protein
MRLNELRNISLILWLYLAFLVFGQFIPSLSGAGTTKWLMIVALLLLFSALELIRRELRDLRKAVTKDVP